MRRTLLIITSALTFGCSTTMGAELDLLRQTNLAPGVVQRSTLANLENESLSYTTKKGPVWLRSWGGGKVCYAYLTREFGEDYLLKEIKTIARPLLPRPAPLRPRLPPRPLNQPPSCVSAPTTA